MPPASDLAQLGVAGMAIFALISVVVFALRAAHSHAKYSQALEGLVRESMGREKALQFSLEKSREDRIRLEGILSQNTEAWRDSMQALARVAALVEVRH